MGRTLSGEHGIGTSKAPYMDIAFNDAEMNASSTIDYVDESYVDETYYSDFTALDIIKAKASGSNIQLEYFVAST